MSHAAAIAPSLRDHLSGPPGSGKTAALADRIAAAIRGGANPHVLLVVAPSRAGAGALVERVRRLCGSKRTKRYFASAPSTTFYAWLPHSSPPSPSPAVP